MTTRRRALHDDVKAFAVEQRQVDFKNANTSYAETVDGDHGRIETRKVTVFNDIAWLRERHNWPSLNAVVMVESVREIGDRGTVRIFVCEG